jgi:hypothetical protein
MGNTYRVAFSGWNHPSKRLIRRLSVSAAKR